MIEMNKDKYIVRINGEKI